MIVDIKIRKELTMILSIGEAGLSNVDRPVLNLAPDSAGNSNNSFWSAITFESTVNHFDICGKRFEKVALYPNQEEVYFFYDAVISLMPQSKIGQNTFVMIYAKCELVNKTNSTDDCSSS